MNTIINDNHVLENIYGDSVALLKSLFKTYKDIYQLPEFIHEDPDVVPEAFEYAKKRLYFVILVLHTTQGYVCFQRSFDHGHLSLNLPGASIHLGKDDTIITAIERVAIRSFKGAKIADIAPIISLTNKFYCQNGETFEHYGLGVRALLLNDIQDVKNVSREVLYKGKFSKDFPSKNIPHAPARETYKVFKDWFNEKQYATYINEIEAQNKYFWRYTFHQSFVNPILKVFSYWIGKHSIKDIKNKMLDKVGSAYKAIDIACGDDKGIFDHLCNVNLFVANDISSDQIISMKKKYDSLHSKLPKSSSLMFTNHDCLDLPFGDKVFDVAICRNVLHHMIAKADLLRLFENISRVAKRVIICEIEDPNKEGIYGRIRHRYYMEFLKDEGKHFYTQDDFEKVIGSTFNGSKIEFEYLSTIRGMYMFAEINC
jgi:ubiquinone/menaquinone biosynthesis C-methylase UbiE